MPQSPNLQPFVDKLGRNSWLSAEERQAILGLPSELKRIAPQRDFVRLGEVTNHACLIVRGIVARFGQTMAGQRQITALHVPADMPDLHSVVMPRGTGALQTLCDTTLLYVPHGPIRRAAARYPAIAEALWRECEIDAGRLTEWLLNIGRRDARARIAHLLCEMAMRLGADLSHNRARFELPLTQVQIADAISLTPVHVNRTLRALRVAGLASFAHRHILIQDWNGLAAAGEFDPAYLHMEPEAVEPLRLVR